jgi:apolipoprotein N-acyltransferase
VTLVQPSIPQTLIWNGSKEQERFRELLRLSEQALTNATDLLVWPEAAIPKLLRYDPEIREGVTQLARTHQVWMIVGSDDVEPDPDSGPRATRYFNCAFLISPAGEIVERYGKRHLVIFGEYIPFVRWLPFLKWFTPIDGGFTAGTEATRFELTDLKVSLAPLICYEDVFPQLARAGAVGDTDLLVNLTNDGWFGEGAAQWQQAAGAAFRAVENGLPLVRCANTGLSCWMDAGGGIREIVTDDAGGVYGAGFRTVTIPLVDQRAPTFYQQHGDWLGWGCVGLTVLVLGGRWLGRKAA